MGDRKTCEVARIGDARIKMFNGYERVKHVAEFKRNLISLGTLYRYGYKYKVLGELLKISNEAHMVMKGVL